MGAGGQREARTLESSILTKRLNLRPRTAADDIALRALAANPAIAPNLCTTIAEEGGRSLAIVERKSGRLIGGAEHGVGGLGSGIEMTVWIGEADWGGGLATEAAHGLIDHLFADEATEMLWCSIRVTNGRARRVTEKCGFQFRGTGMVRVPGRGAFPVERFALDRRNWTSLKAWAAADGGVRRAPTETAA